MNILRERKRSKVFKRKCFYLNYQATTGICREIRVILVRNELRQGCRQLASSVGMR
jgi:hypothetical protein